jgi:predicted secreted acid phosphatase
VPAADAPPLPPARIVAYHDSGRWARDTTDVIARARRFVDRRHEEYRRHAVVLDVDDTALSTYRCMRRAGFVRRRARCGERRRLPAIGQTRALYRHLRAAGVAVFFVTGRRESARARTLANLRLRGYAGRLRLRMRADGPRRLDNARYKARERRRIAARGDRILANVGDQASDLAGGGALRAFKLPNPMYVTR